MTNREELTILPPADLVGLCHLEPLISVDHSPTAKLVGSDGEEHILPAEVFDVIREVVAVMAEGKAVMIVPVHQQLTTQEAADLLGIRRPALIELLDAGDIPFEQVGRHRRVRLIDVLEYRRYRSEHRREALGEIVAVSENAGMYELTAIPVLTR